MFLPLICVFLPPCLSRGGWSYLLERAPSDFEGALSELQSRPGENPIGRMAISLSTVVATLTTYIACFIFMLASDRLEMGRYYEDQDRQYYLARALDTYHVRKVRHVGISRRTSCFGRFESWLLIRVFSRLQCWLEAYWQPHLQGRFNHKPYA